MAVSQETLAILGVGIALAGIIFTSNGQLSARIDRLESRMDRLETRMDRLDVRLAAVEREAARIIGFLEGSDTTGHSPSPLRSPAEGEGVGVEPLPPRTSLPG